MSATPSKVIPLSLASSPSSRSASPGGRWTRDRKDRNSGSSSVSVVSPSKDSATTCITETPRTSRSSIPPSPMSPSTSAPTKYPKPDLEPLSFEDISNLKFDFESRYQAIHSPIFPVASKTLQVTSLPRLHREIRFKDLLPNAEVRKLLPYYVQICLRYFENDWCVLVRDKFTSLSSLSQLPASSLQKLDYHLGAPLLTEMPSQIEPFSPELLLSHPTPQDLATGRTKNRRQIFETASRTADDGEEYKTPQMVKILSSQVNLFHQHPIVSFILEPKQLTWELGDFEPMWCSIAAYDVNLRRRVSESFYFAPNSFFSNKLIGVGPKNEVDYTKKAIFSFTRTSPDIFLVLRIEKVLQGDLDDITKPYLEGQDYKAKLRDKLKANIEDVCSRLRVYRQQFAWSMIPLFDSEDGDLTAQELSFSPIFRHKTELSDEALLESISSASTATKSKGTGTRKAKTLRGSLSFHVQPLPDYPNLTKLLPARFISSSFLELTPFDSLSSPSSSSSPSPSSPSSSSAPLSPPSSPSSAAHPQPIIRELQEFPPKPFFSPLMDYRNNLYVYPTTLSMGKADNYMLRVLFLQADTNSIVDPRSLDGLPVIYDSLSPEFRKSMTTSVVYKSKMASFCDELKLQLPAQLTPQHHLLFIVYRVNVKPPKKNEPSNPETPCAFCFLPIYKEACVIGVEQELLGFADLPSGYLTLPLAEKNQIGGLRPIEGGKPILKLRVVLSSTIYSQDRPLSRALALFAPGDEPADLLRNTQAIHALREVPPPVLLSYLPLIVEHHLYIMSIDLQMGDKTHQGLADLSTESIVALSRLFQTLIEFEPTLNRILHSYVQYVFNPALYPSLFLRVIDRWLSALRTANGTDDNLVSFAFFFFGIIFKSLLHYSQSLPSSFSLSALPHAFYSGVQLLITQLIWETQSRSTTGVVIGKDLMYALVFFLHDLLRVVNRGFVIKLIALITNRLCPNDNDLTLIDFAFAFLRHITQAPDWIHLNIPTASLTFSLEDLFSNFSSHHFLSGLYLSHLAHYSSHKEQVIRLQAYSLLRTHLYDLFFDPRYQDIQFRSRIAELYFPYIVTIIDRIHLIQAANHAEKRHLFICFLYLLHAVPSAMFRYWWQIDTVHRLCRFFETLRVCLEVFAYIGQHQLVDLMGVDQGAQVSDSTKAQLEEFYTTGPPVRKVGGRNFRTIRNEQRSAASGNRTKPGFVFDESKEMNLSAEASFTILDTVSEFLSHAREKIVQEKAPFELFSKIFQVYLSFLRLQQCTEFMRHFHPALRSMISNFPSILFSSNQTHFIAELTTLLITHANHSVPELRSQALASLFHMMLVNFQTVPDRQYTRSKVQFFHSISHLEEVPTVSLQAGFRSLEMFLDTPAAQPIDHDFVAQLRVLLTRGKNLLCDMQDVLRVSYDLETKHDLYVRIADTYPDVVDLRIYWLEKLAQDHAQHEQWAEAAAALFHIIALSAQYLCLAQEHATASKKPELSQHLQYQGWPTSLANLAQLLSPNLSSETLLPSLVIRDTDSVTESSRFGNVNNFVNTCAEAIGYLHKATLWESIYNVNKLVIPIYEHRREFHKLTDLFDDLNQCYLKAHSDFEARTRTLGQYYRVVLHGSIFGPDAGVEYVYKTPLLTRLGQIKSRLEEIFSAKYGEGRVSVWPKTEPPENIPPDQGFIQIIAVEPYFDSKELSTTKVTYYEQNCNINRFYYSAPFTKSSAQQHADSIADQWVKQYIITTEKYFPHIKNRLRVVSFDIVEISPIEASIETIESQIRKFQLEIRNPNAKSLQMVLQGSLLVQVQAGPKAIASTFFDPAVSHTVDPKLLDKLRSSFQGFLKICREAISFNRLIAPDQVLLQEELENSYAQFEVLLTDLGVVQSVVRRFQAVQAV